MQQSELIQVPSSSGVQCRQAYYPSGSLAGTQSAVCLIPDLSAGSTRGWAEWEPKMALSLSFDVFDLFKYDMPVY